MDKAATALHGKTEEKPVTIATASVKTQTGYLPNTGQMCH